MSCVFIILESAPGTHWRSWPQEEEVFNIICNDRREEGGDGWKLWDRLERRGGNSKYPFVVALYCGNTKPEIKLVDFVKEMEVLLHDGLIVNLRRFKVEVSAIICDAPAKAYVRQSKQFSGYEGERIESLLFGL